MSGTAPTSGPVRTSASGAVSSGAAPVSGVGSVSGGFGPASGLGVSNRPGSGTLVSTGPVSAGVVSGVPSSRGTVYGRGVRPVGGPETEPSVDLGPPAGADLPAHGLATAELDRLELPVDPSGVILGADVESRPVAIRLFREQSTRLTLIGGLWVTRLMLLRALGVGARIVIQTQRPGAWQGWGKWATGFDDRVEVVQTAPMAVAPGSASAPVLVVNDSGPSPAPLASGLGPWQTRLTVLPELSAFGFGAVADSDLVLMQRLSPAESSAAGAVLRLTSQTAGLMQAMHDDMLALLGGGADRYLWVNATPIEREAFGPPRRG
ncbi:hypothetical protein [Fodinicola feengrottensis]|uniref:hypothetical protein n=1 Tax=Fodinicola feengrottensis TaxID=435914 RepID=UPI0031DC613A